MTGGMAFEGLNNSSNRELKKNFIIILNDNNLSIAENVGGMSKYLNGIRTNENYLELKAMLEQKGIRPVSATDTEIAALLLGFLYNGDPVAAIRAATANPA